MKKHYSKKLGNVVEINESQIQDDLGELVRGNVEETLNSMLDAEADICLVESLGDFYPRARWQRCTVHFYWNIFSFVPKAKIKVHPGNEYLERCK